MKPEEIEIWLKWDDGFTEICDDEGIPFLYVKDADE